MNEATEDLAAISAALADREVEGIERIGERFGFASRVYRVQLDGGTSVVAKLFTAESTSAEVAARRLLGEALGPSMPAVVSSAVSDDRGVLVIEHVVGRQGDVLVDPGPGDAGEVATVLGRLHARHLGVRSEWSLPPWDRAHWRSRVEVALSRYPATLDPIADRLLERYPDAFSAAVDRVAGGPSSVIHGDAHLDNVLWRPNGTAVILDWNRVKRAPAALDLGSMTFGVEFGDIDAAYAAALGDATAADAVLARIGDAHLVQVRGVIGWAGLPDDPPDTNRKEAVRRRAVEAAARLAADL